MPPEHIINLSYGRRCRAEYFQVVPVCFCDFFEFFGNDERFFLCFLFLSTPKDYSRQFTKRRIIQLFSVFQFFFCKSIIIMGSSIRDAVMSGVKRLYNNPASLWPSACTPRNL